MPSRRSERGLAAAAVVVVLILVAVVLVLGRGFFKTAEELNQRAQTETNLRRISDALVQYASLNQRLPCPALGNVDTGDADPDTAATSCAAADGTVPWRTLALEREAALDGWGRKISYRVFSGATGFTRLGGASSVNCNSLLRAPLDPALDTDGFCKPPSGTAPPNTTAQFLAARGNMLVVQDAGTARNGNAFVLISHGATGRGSYPAGTGERAQLPSAAGNEYANALSTGPFVIAAHSDPSVDIDAAAHFDDVLAYTSYTELATRAKIAARTWSQYPQTATFSLANVAAAVTAAGGTMSGESTGMTSLALGAFLITGSSSSGSSTISVRTEGGVTGIGAIGGGSTAGDLNSAFDERLTFQLVDESEFGKVDVALNAFRIVDYFPLQKERAEISLWRAGDTLQTTTVESWDPNGDPTRCLYRLVTAGIFDRVDVAPIDQSGGGGSTRFTVAGIKACTDSTTPCTTEVAGASACPVSPPSATTVNATSLATTSATLNGKIEDNGITMGTGSGYLTNGAAYGFGTQSITLINGSGTIVAGNCVSISGDSNTYIVASGISAPGTIVLSAPGLRQSISAFTFPTVTLVPCTTTVAFDYGLTCAYGSSIAASPASVNAGTGSTNVSASVGSLSCGTAYYFRTRATGRGGITTGNNARFRTSACAAPRPGAESLQPTAITATTATLLGIASDNGSTTTVTFDFGETSCYGTTVTATPNSVVAGTGMATVSAAVTGLTCNIYYHYRTRAVSGLGTTVGDDVVFRTLPCP